MNIACPQCKTVYRIDPARVPGEGVTARCRECGAAMRVVQAPEARRPGGVVTAAAVADTARDAEAGVAPAAAAVESPSSPASGPAAAGAPAFGPQDPGTRARRLARALVSDIKVYNPDRWEESRAAGTLRNDFRDEILKSWEEYVEQVGEDMAKKTPYFRDALNQILAEGKRVF